MARLTLSLYLSYLVIFSPSFTLLFSPFSSFSTSSSSFSSSSSSILVESICVIKQNCTFGVGCRPVPVEPWEREPFKQPDPRPTCPQYADYGCCTEQQNQLLMVNFLSIQSAFANIANGGCPACALNVEEFWCAYSCSPNQDQFLSIIGVATVPDPTRGGLPTEVLKTSVRIDRNFTCASYTACQDVKTVKETSTMSTAEGFFAYQGQYEAIQHGAYIDFEYIDEPFTPLNVNTTVHPPTYSCCSYPNDVTNLTKGNTSCPCAYCSGMCNGGKCSGSGDNSVDGITNLGEITAPWYNGIEPGTIGGVWGALVFVIITVTWWRHQQIKSIRQTDNSHLAENMYSSLS